jgi:hypothetical protein
MSTTESETRHSGESRNPAIKIIREADKILMSTRFAGTYLTNWIPACAGMTATEVMA